MRWPAPPAGPPRDPESSWPSKVGEGGARGTSLFGGNAYRSPSLESQLSVPHPNCSTPFSVSSWSWMLSP